MSWKRKRITSTFCTSYVLPMTRSWLGHVTGKSVSGQWKEAPNWEHIKIISEGRAPNQANSVIIRGRFKSCEAWTFYNLGYPLLRKEKKIIHAKLLGLSHSFERDLWKWGALECFEFYSFTANLDAHHRKPLAFEN